MQVKRDAESLQRQTTAQAGIADLGNQGRPGALESGARAPEPKKSLGGEEPGVAFLQERFAD